MAIARLTGKALDIVNKNKEEVKMKESLRRLDEWYKDKYVDGVITKYVPSVAMQINTLLDSFNIQSQYNLAFAEDLDNLQEENRKVHYQTKLISLLKKYVNPSYYRKARKIAEEETEFKLK